MKIELSGTELIAHHILRSMELDEAQSLMAMGASTGLVDPHQFAAVTYGLGDINIHFEAHEAILNTARKIVLHVLGVTEERYEEIEAAVYGDSGQECGACEHDDKVDSDDFARRIMSEILSRGTAGKKG